jgi:ferredoxin
MAELIILRNGEKTTVSFEGQALLDTLLEKAGIRTPHPCGGRGSCGKCWTKQIPSVFWKWTAA